MTTFADLKTQLAARFRDPSNNVISAAQWGEYINQAYRKANGTTPLWPWLQTSEQTINVTANTRATALPTDTVQVNWVYNTTNNYRLTPIDGHGAQWDNGVLRTETGNVKQYRIRGSNIEVFPLANGATVLVAECVTFPGSLTGTDEPAWPEPFHELLLEGALALAYQDDGNLPWHDRHWEKFLAGVKEMEQTLLAFRTEAYPLIVDTFWR